MYGVPMSPTAPPRKRTKTFTGCWTCRARKIKCDETTPSCRQCSDKGLHCEGYSARLQWLTPATHEQGLYPEGPLQAPMKRSLRRLFTKEPAQPTLKWGQVDTILDYLDSLESVVNDSDGVSANVKNFGVFSLGHTPPASNQVDGYNARCSALGLSKTHPPEAELERPFDPIATLNPPRENADGEAAWTTCDPDDSGQIVVLPSLEQDPLTSPNRPVFTPRGVDASFHFNSPSAISPGSHDPREFILSDKGSGGKTANQAEQHLLPPEKALNSLVISPQERFLMNHYSNRVVNLFCVIDNAKSPWKTIHLPRVLQCAGELSFGGATTRIRDALRKSLLSISAFYLSNDNRTKHNSLEAENWGTVASRYRCGAIGLLKYAVETDLYSDKRPKYKEFLATMLSMVTINVMSGDTSTCSVHLDGVEKLISFMNSRKPSFSRKATSLHRIYLYLRVIYETTAVTPSRNASSRFSPSLSCSKTFGHETRIPDSSILIESTHTPYSTLPIADGMMAGESPLPELSSYECIYGIPMSLLLLLKETIEVIDQVQLHQANTPIQPFPEPLDRICDEVEQKIMDWSQDEPFDLDNASRNSTSGTIIYHQTRAFLNALIIFFSQGVRFMGYRYLRQYVSKILDSIEAIEQIKTETKILAAPLFWPSFMGAVEAFDTIHQERFRRWYSRVEIYGIEAVRTGIKVVHEVWRRGPANHRERNSGWREVVKQSDESLMLT